jgi:hypothetical protein
VRWRRLLYVMLVRFHVPGCIAMMSHRLAQTADNHRGQQVKPRGPANIIAANCEVGIMVSLVSTVDHVSGVRVTGMPTISTTCVKRFPICRHIAFALRMELLCRQ